MEDSCERIIRELTFLRIHERPLSKNTTIHAKNAIVELFKGKNSSDKEKLKSLIKEAINMLRQSLFTSLIIIHSNDK